jgi:hypothetical protein
MHWTSFFTFVLNWSTMPEVKIPLHFTLIKSLLTPQIPSFYKIISSQVPQYQSSMSKSHMQIQIFKTACKSTMSNLTWF